MCSDGPPLRLAALGGGAASLVGRLAPGAGGRRRGSVARREPDGGPVLAVGELGDARLLERVERRGGVLRMVAAFLAGPPQRERPEQGAEEEDGEPRARERRVPSLADETKSASG